MSLPISREPSGDIYWDPKLETGHCHFDSCRQKLKRRPPKLLDSSVLNATEACMMAKEEKTNSHLTNQRCNENHKSMCPSGNKKGPDESITMASLHPKLLWH
ncbi:uncharacterized protein LOC144336469 isoform X2 [Macaca mulatta]